MLRESCKHSSSCDDGTGPFRFRIVDLYGTLPYKLDGNRHSFRIRYPSGKGPEIFFCRRTYCRSLDEVVSALTNSHPLLSDCRIVMECLIGNLRSMALCSMSS